MCSCNQVQYIHVIKYSTYMYILYIVYHFDPHTCIHVHCTCNKLSFNLHVQCTCMWSCTVYVHVHVYCVYHSTNNRYTSKSISSWGSGAVMLPALRVSIPTFSSSLNRNPKQMIHSYTCTCIYKYMYTLCITYNHTCTYIVVLL